MTVAAGVQANDHGDTKRVRIRQAAKPIEHQTTRDQNYTASFRTRTVVSRYFHICPRQRPCLRCSLLYLGTIKTAKSRYLWADAICINQKWPLRKDRASVSDGRYL